MKHQSFTVYTGGPHRKPLDSMVENFVREKLLNEIITAPREVVARRGIIRWLARKPWIDISVQRMYRILKDLEINPYHVE